MNPIENMWIEVKRTVQETWPVLLPRNSNELSIIVSDVWDEVASSQHYVRSLIESVTRMKSVVESTWVLDFLLKRPVYENSPFKG
jgi:hypothetical protein